MMEFDLIDEEVDRHLCINIWIGSRWPPLNCRIGLDRVVDNGRSIIENWIGNGGKIWFCCCVERKIVRIIHICVINMMNLIWGTYNPNTGFSNCVIWNNNNKNKKEIPCFLMCNEQCVKRNRKETLHYTLHIY